MKILAVVSCFLFLGITPVNAQERDCPDQYRAAVKNRKGQIVVINNTGMDLLEVGFAHRHGKFGPFGRTQLKDKGMWKGSAEAGQVRKPAIPVGGRSTPKIVNFKTGAGTGADYWIFVWSYKEDDEVKVFATAPSNLLGSIEAIIDSAKKVVGTLGNNIPIVGEVIGAAVITATLDVIHDKRDSVAGFRHHTLRCEDVGINIGTAVEITLGTDQVKVKSARSSSSVSFQSLDKVPDVSNLHEIYKAVESQVKVQATPEKPKEQQ